MLDDLECNMTAEIWVRLLDEGTNVYLPVLAEVLDDNIFRLLASDDYDPEDERWEFLPGSLVRCVQERRDGGTVLIADHLISPPASS